MLNRAYSVLDIRSVDEDKRILEGIATTPSTDRMGDIIETDGIEFKLPIPLLFQHNSREPIGTVTRAKVTKSGIEVTAKMAAPGVAQYIDQAWALIKNGLVRGFSIGFRPLEHAWMDDSSGIRFIRTEWMELSAVTIPANTDATILTVKSADTAALAAIGNRAPVSTTRTVPAYRLTESEAVAINFPGVSGPTKTRGSMPPTIRETIASSEAKISANESRIDDLVQRSITEGRTAEEAEIQEIDTLKAETSKLTSHVALLKERETSMVARATPVPAQLVTTGNAAAIVRSGSPITVQSNAPKGINVARAAIALYHARGIKSVAADLAAKHWPDDPSVRAILEWQQRAGVDAGDTTTSGWASQLVPAAANPQNDFIEMLRANTILFRISGFKQVPFNVAIPIQTAAGTYQWVGEAAGKPVTSLTFSSVTLRWAKAAGIIVITQELAKFSSPSAEVIVRDEMLAGLTRFLDTQFIGTAAEVSNVSPAGILNGISSTATTGTTAAFFRTDMNNMLNNFTANNVDPSKLVLIMSATQAIALSLMITDLGVPLFPSISVNGGSILGMPVIVSEAVGTKIIALDASQILYAQDGGIQIDVSREASVEMETAPAVGEQSPLSTLTNLKSLWQNNLVGFRAEIFVTWKYARTAAVEYITGNAYVP